MKRKILSICIAISLVSIFIGCTNSTAKRAIEEGKIAVVSSEYDKALGLFKLAVDESGDNKAKEDYNILNTYIEAKKAYEELEYNKALELVNEIIEADTYENLHKDIVSLKEEIGIKKDIIDNANENIDKINNFIEEDELDKAFKIINGFDTEGLSNDIIDEIRKLQEVVEEAKLKKVEEEKNTIINDGLNILKQYGYNDIGFDKIVNEDLSVKEINNIDLYRFLGNSENSHDEFYYNPKNNKMYMINQGMWFIINENYKNVTPKDSPMYEAAENYKNYISGEKIKLKG